MDQPPSDLGPPSPPPWDDAPWPHDDEDFHQSPIPSPPPLDNDGESVSRSPSPRSRSGLFSPDQSESPHARSGQFSPEQSESPHQSARDFPTLPTQDSNSGSHGAKWRPAFRSGKATLQDAVAVMKSLPNTYGFLYGKGQSYKVYRCKDHQSCPSLLRIRQSKVDGKFEIAYSVHEHATVDSIARRGVPPVLRVFVERLIRARKTAMDIVTLAREDPLLGEHATALDGDDLYRRVRNRIQTVSRRAKGPLVLENSSDLVEWGVTNVFPPSIAAFDACEADTMYVLPHGYRPDVQAVVFSSRNILSNAVRAFIAKPDSFCIMVDGTWKFHYGGWVLVTVGTTSLGWNRRYGGLSNTFRPIAYCFSSGENTRAVEMLLEAVKFSCDRSVYTPMHHPR